MDALTQDEFDHSPDVTSSVHIELMTLKVTAAKRIVDEYTSGDFYMWCSMYCSICTVSMQMLRS